MKRKILILVICLLLVFGTGFAAGTAIWLRHDESVNVRCMGTVDLVVVREGPGAVIASCPVPK